MVNVLFAPLYQIASAAVYHHPQHAWIAAMDIIYPKEFALDALLLDAQAVVQYLYAPKPQQAIS